MPSAARQPAFPWPPFIALIAVGVIAVVAVWPTRPLHDGSRVVASRELRFVLQPDDSMRVIDAKTSRIAGTVPTIRDGFVPGLLHGMDIIRKHDGVPTNLPYRITEMSDGRVLLIDPPTKSEIDLESFGSGNAQRFVAYLHTQEGHTQEGHTQEGHTQEGHSQEGHTQEGHSQEGKS